MNAGEVPARGRCDIRGNTRNIEPSLLEAP